MVTYLRLIEGAIKGIGVGTGGGVSHIKVTGMLVGKFKLNPQGRPMWVWLKLKLKEISVSSVSGLFLCTVLAKRYLNT